MKFALIGRGTESCRVEANDTRLANHVRHGWTVIWVQP